MNRPSDFITPEAAGTLAGLFRERVRRSPAGCAYRRFDQQGHCCECTSWAETAALAARWQEAMRGRDCSRATGWRSCSETAWSGFCSTWRLWDSAL